MSRVLVDFLLPALASLSEQTSSLAGRGQCLWGTWQLPQLVENNRYLRDMLARPTDWSSNPCAIQALEQNLIARAELMIDLDIVQDQKLVVAAGKAPNSSVQAYNGWASAASPSPVRYLGYVPG